MLVGVVIATLLIVPTVLLTQPSPKAAFAVSAHTGTLVMEPMCSERLLWDLPAGRVLQRSAMPGETTRALEGNVTLTLLTGSRVRVESMSRGVLRLQVSRAENMRTTCETKDAPFYELSVDDATVPVDPLGFNYVSAPIDHVGRPPALLLLTGHVVLGDTIQQGAGWDAETGVLESGSVDLRVVPWFGNDRVTLRTEALEEGSLFDTHACLGAPGERRQTDCPPKEATQASGFLRLAADGGMLVQLYVQGAVGTQSFGGEQRVLEISESTAAWHSPALTTAVSLLLIFFALYQGVKTLARDSIDLWRGGGTASAHHHEDEVAAEAAHAAIERTRENEGGHRGAEGARRPGTTARRPIAALALVCWASSAFAEPVEIRQGAYVGAGYSFRRGASCLVVTARHVVPEMGASVTVLDRAGAKAQGSRGYDNEFYDLALITLPDSSLVACTTAWPEAAWMARANFSSNQFQVIRHYPNGRETIVRLQYAGGLRHQLTLAPVDKLTIRESDSGAMVEAGGRLVGIVQSVETATDRVNVLRFDQIDQLVGDRFKRSGAAGPLGYAGVFFRGRQSAEWTTYMQSWLTEKAGRTIVVVEPPSPYGRPDPRRPAAPASSDTPKTSCEVKVEMMSWDRVSIPNPDYSKVELGLEACRKRGFVFEQLCAAARNQQRNTPRMIQSQKLTFNVIVTPKSGPSLTKLETSTVNPPSMSTIGRTEFELGVLQAAVGPTLKAMLDAAPCQ